MSECDGMIYDDQGLKTVFPDITPWHDGTRLLVDDASDSDWRSEEIYISDSERMVVAVDVDDTLLQTVNVFKDWVDSENEGPVFDDWLDYRHALATNLDSPWRTAALESGVLDDLPPFPGAAKGLRALRNAGFRLEVVTSRPESMRDFTKASLDKHFPNMFDDVHLTGSPGPVLKGAVCKHNSACVLVDDSMHQLQDAVQYGVGGVLFDFQGTSGSVQKPPFGVIRLESWEDVSKWIITNHQFRQLR